MKLGFFTMPIHPLDKGLAAIAPCERIAEAFLLADELGFTEAYVGEQRRRQGREHHLLHRVHCLARRAAPSRSSLGPARSTCRTAIRRRSLHPWPCSIICSTAASYLR